MTLESATARLPDRRDRACGSSRRAPVAHASPTRRTPGWGSRLGRTPPLQARRVPCSNVARWPARVPAFDEQHGSRRRIARRVGRGGRSISEPRTATSSSSSMSSSLRSLRPCSAMPPARCAHGLGCSPRGWRRPAHGCGRTPRRRPAARAARPGAGAPACGQRRSVARRGHPWRCRSRRRYRPAGAA